MTKLKGIIVTGKVGEGKTTALLEFVSQNSSCGILTIVSEGKRHFLEISSGKLFPAEIEDAETESGLKVGKFVFKKEAFQKARKSILECIDKDVRTIIIDEYGHLELSGEGLEPLLDKLVKLICKKNIVPIVVVRKSLIAGFLRRFNSVNWEIIYFKDFVKMKF